jgi:polyhydroxyalkanoate synthase
VKYVLGGSGHIAGVINPPEKNKYGFWTNAEKTADPDAWFDGATHTGGSWWLNWVEWLGERSGGEVDAREPGSSKYKPIEDAPGSYVKERSG